MPKALGYLVEAHRGDPQDKIYLALLSSPIPVPNFTWTDNKDRACKFRKAVNANKATQALEKIGGLKGIREFRIQPIEWEE